MSLSAQDLLFAARAGQVAKTTRALAYDPMPPFMRASLALRQATPCGVAFLGSSTFAGTNASQPYNRVTNRLLGFMQRAYPNGITADESSIQQVSTGTKLTAAGVHGYVSGIGGATSANYLTSALVSSLTALAPAVVIHMATTNDYRSQVAPATTQANLQSWISQLRAAQTVPTLHILVLPYAPFDGPGTNGAYAIPQSAYGAVMQAIADDPQNDGWVVFLDISGAYTPLGIPPTNTKSDVLGLIDTDHIHQLDKGHFYMAEVFRERLGIPVENVPVVMLPNGGTPRVGETYAESLVVTRNA